MFSSSQVPWEGLTKIVGTKTCGIHDTRFEEVHWNKGASSQKIRWNWQREKQQNSLLKAEVELQGEGLKMEAGSGTLAMLRLEGETSSDAGSYRLLRVWGTGDMEERRNLGVGEAYWTHMYMDNMSSEEGCRRSLGVIWRWVSCSGGC